MECGWSCKNCIDQSNLHLHVEIENLKQKLLEREHHIVTMETNFLAEADKYPNGELAAVTDELLTWQEKYSRLYESYKRVQKVNQNLEDKLLKIVDKFETEKNGLLRDVTSLTQRLNDAKGKVNRLQNENERYRNDVNLAIQLLQCKPSNFVSQKYDSLPADLQQKVLYYMCGKRRTSDGSTVPIKIEMKTIKVPVPSAPPASMVYAVNKSSVICPTRVWCSRKGYNILPQEDEDNCEEVIEVSKPPVDSVSAAIMAKVLEERERERQNMKHCESCQCNNEEYKMQDQSTQTTESSIVCSKCSLELNNMPSKTIVDSTNRGSQGLVRYVDVVATRTNESSNIYQNLYKSGEYDSSLKGVSRLGVKIDDFKTSKSWNWGTEQENSQFIEINNKNCENQSVVMNGVNSSSILPLNCSNFSKSDNNVYNLQSSLKVDALKSSDSTSEIMQNISNDLETDLSQSNNVNKLAMNQNNDIALIPDNNVDNKSCNVEVSLNRGNDISSSIVNKNLPLRNFTSHDLNKMLQPKSSVENSALKKKNKEGRTFLADDANKSVPNSWSRVPVDANKKTVLPGEKRSSQVPLLGIVKPTETSISKLPFTNTSKQREKSFDAVSGPRLCSMRVQAGTSNILLDNATSYEPILYTSRHSQQDGVESWSISTGSDGAAVLVHTPRNHSAASSTEDTVKTSHNNKGDQWLTAPSETEI